MSDTLDDLLNALDAEPKDNIKMLFRSEVSNKTLVDAMGVEIKIGDKLTWGFHDEFYEKEGVEDWMKEPIFIVEHISESRKGLCGRGISKPLFLNAAKFQYCEIIKN